MVCLQQRYSAIPDNLDVVEKTQIASWISVAMLPLCIFILISYAVLAPKWTHRHYTNIPLTAGIALMEVGYCERAMKHTDG